jgi:FkbM family methyltransferase
MHTRVMDRLVWFSQQAEDFFVWLNFINVARSDGVCVEIGGSDGVTYSNSMFFEKRLGFKCVLIEPEEKFFRKLVMNRPQAICVKAAVTNSEALYVEFVGDDFTGGCTDTMSEQHLQHYHKAASKVAVPNMKMETILDDLSVTHIDFFSLDVEGGELQVLESINWKKVSIYVVAVELDGHNEEKDDLVRELLSKQGFKYQHHISINEFWVNPKYERKDILFDSKLRPDYKGEDLNNYGIHAFLWDQKLRDRLGQEVASYKPKQA